MTSLSMLLIGFLLGMQHATEADHLAAVATLATRQNSLAQTMRQGVAWGVGHTLTLMLLGGVVLALGTAIPQHFSQALEFGVGLMLIALGADVLRRVVRQRIHIHAHSHGGGLAHVHAHSHEGEGAHVASKHHHAHRTKPPLRALAIGMMHGMAGSAALILLSLGAAQSPTLGLLYIVLFGIGSIVGMGLLSIAIAIPFRLSAAHRVTWLSNGMKTLVGGFTCALGAFTVYEIGFVEGLLRG